MKAGVTAADLIASGVTDITGEASNYSYQSVLCVTRQLGGGFNHVYRRHHITD